METVSFGNQHSSPDWSDFPGFKAGGAADAAPAPPKSDHPPSARVPGGTAVTVPATGPGAPARWPCHTTELSSAPSPAAAAGQRGPGGRDGLCPHSHGDQLVLQLGLRDDVHLDGVKQLPGDEVLRDLRRHRRLRSSRAPSPSGEHPSPLCPLPLQGRYHGSVPAPPPRAGAAGPGPLAPHLVGDFGPQRGVELAEEHALDAAAHGGTRNSLNPAGHRSAAPAESHGRAAGAGPHIERQRCSPLSGGAARRGGP